MDPVTSIIVPAFVGGLVVALLVALVHRRSKAEGAALPGTAQSMSTDMINMAHIRVAGVGGLGFVLIALWIGVVTPGLRGPLVVGAVSGAVLAVVLIAWRRRTGPMTSSGQRPGANTTLAIDDIPAQRADDDRADVQRPIASITSPSATFVARRAGP